MSRLRAVSILAGLAGLAGSATGQQPGSAFLDPIYNHIRIFDQRYGIAVNPSNGLLEDLQLDLYLPQGDARAQRPTYVHVHGGAYMWGSRRDGGPVTMCQWFADRGFVAASIGYRLERGSLGGIGAPSVADDIKMALRWLRANAGLFGIDPERIVVAGDSAGAEGAMYAAYNPTQGGVPSHANAVIDLWGEKVTEIRAGGPPLLVVHGTADVVVPYFHATDIMASALANNVDAELLTLAGVGHNAFHLHSVFGTVAAYFMYERLRLHELAGLTGDVAPGTLSLRLTGGQARFGVLLVSGGTLSWPLPGIGVLCLAPPLVQVGYFGFGPIRVGGVDLPIPIPPGLQGTLYWQLGYAGAGGLEALSNCHATTF